MNILLIIRRFDFGGAENYVCDLANEFHKRGHQVRIIAKPGRQTARLHPEISFHPLIFRDLMLPLHVVWLLYFIFRYRINVIHANQCLPILLSSIAGFISRIRVVATVHGRARYDLRHFLARKLLDKIIFVSKTVMYYGEKSYKFGPKAEYIPNGIVLSEYRDERILYRIFYISKINKYHFQFISMLLLRVLPALLEKYPELEFHVIGDGRRLEELEALVEKQNHLCGKECCKVRGYQPDVISGLGSASLIMGVGRVALEAAANGIPVISVNSRRMGGALTLEKYHLIKNNNFIDPSGDVPTEDAMIEALQDFFENIDKRNADAEQIAKLTRDEFSMVKIVDQIEIIYKS